MKKTFFSLAAFFLTIVLLFSVAEILLRMKGHEPWKYRDPGINEPTMLHYDSVLGWTSKKGRYFIPRYKPEGTDINMTFIADGIRDTGDVYVDADKRDKIVVVGGSFTQGWAISDNETYTWKLQERFSLLKVINYGIGGYGTYQSLLVLEKELPRIKSPLIVLYGFLDEHQTRNVAPVSWLESLQKVSKRGHVYLPFATLDNAGLLVRHLPERYPETPLREYSATITYFESKYAKLKGMGREKQKQLVTEKLILEMKKLSEKFGARFIVPALWLTEFREQYTDFFKKNNIEFINCSRRITRDFKVPGEGHPNDKLNSIWAECISSYLSENIIH